MSATPYFFTVVCYQIRQFTQQQKTNKDLPFDLVTLVTSIKTSCQQNLSIKPFQGETAITDIKELQR